MYPNANDTFRPLRILVISGSPFARAGLAALITGQPGLMVAGQISPDEYLPDALTLYRPDVLIWEMGWEPLQVVDRLADLREPSGRPLIPILALIANDSNAAASAGLLVNAGVRGVLMQDANPDRLAAALTALGQGLAVFTPAYLPTPLSGLPDAGRELAAPVDALTPRESEVLQLIAEGLPNKIIAGKLNISEHTVKFHVNAILTKLGAQSRTEAVVRATRAGLIAL